MAEDLVKLDLAHQRIVEWELGQRFLQLLDRESQRGHSIVAVLGIAEGLVAICSSQLALHLILQREQFVGGERPFVQRRAALDGDCLAQLLV